MLTNIDEDVMNVSSVNRLASDYQGRHVFRNVLLLVAFVAFSTHLLPDHSKGSTMLHRATAYAYPTVLGGREASCTSFQHSTVANCLPYGEAQFTPEQLQQYYRVYNCPDAQYLRTLFDAYLHNPGGFASVQTEEPEDWTSTEYQFQLLHKWNKNYFRSKFVVLSRERNPFGGTVVAILFSDHPNRVFMAWVYPCCAPLKLTLRRFDNGDFNDEDVRRLSVRYKRLIEDNVHAM